MLSIGVSSGLLAAETHTFPRSGSQADVAFGIVDVLFTVLFAGEMLLKMYAFQVYKNPASYLRSSFNVLDVVVVAASLLTLAFESVGALRSRAAARAAAAAPVGTQAPVAEAGDQRGDRVRARHRASAC